MRDRHRREITYWGLERKRARETKFRGILEKREKPNWRERERERRGLKRGEGKTQVGSVMA